VLDLPHRVGKLGDDGWAAGLELAHFRVLRRFVADQNGQPSGPGRAPTRVMTAQNHGIGPAMPLFCLKRSLCVLS
jgi:hypothetical protein